MNEFSFWLRDRLQGQVPPIRCHDTIYYLLDAEEQILRSISWQQPLEKILNEICNALDCQLGNMVSLVSLPEDNAISAAEIAQNVALFGLHVFSSVGITAENGSLLGSLEVFCCVARRPSDRELQVIARAACLAAIAVSRAGQARGKEALIIHEDKLVNRFLPKWPDSKN
jgi:hypothetical protein